MDDKFLEAGFGALGGGGKRTPSKQKEGFERAILSAKVKSSTAGIKPGFLPSLPCVALNNKETWIRLG